jgi:hypothetical protein
LRRRRSEREDLTAIVTNDSHSILAAWWLITALEDGVDDRGSLVEALLSIDGGPSWLSNGAHFKTQGTDYPLAIEGAQLMQYRSGWQVVDSLDLDPVR